MISSLALLNEIDKNKLTSFNISKIPVLNIIALMNLFLKQGYKPHITSSSGGLYLEVNL